MPNQSDIQTTILNGEYSLGILSNNNIAIVNSGGLQIKSDFIQWFRLNLQALQYQLTIGDYISSTTQTLYDRINNFIGIPYNATLDPNFQSPNTTINIINESGSVMVIPKDQANLVEDGSGSGNWYLPFLDEDDQPFASNIKPFELTVGGVGIALQPNYNFTPMRLYGFANNLTQTIELTVI